MQPVRTIEISELDSAGILAACRSFVPVSTRVPAAIAAHRIAFCHYSTAGTEEARTLAMYTLRAVIVARTPKVSDSQEQLDYLTGLPEMAWDCHAEYTLQEVREATLDAIRRSIAWMNDHSPALQCT